MNNRIKLLVAALLALGGLALLLGLLGPGAAFGAFAHAQATNGQHCQFEAITVMGGMGVTVSDTLPGAGENRTIYFSNRGGGVITITAVLTDLHETDPSYVWASPAFGRSTYLGGVVSKTAPSTVFTYPVPGTESSATVILTSSHYITGSMYAGLYQTRTLVFERVERYYLPLFLDEYPCIPFVNGSFESGKPPWHYGERELDERRVEPPAPVHDGNWAVLLGDPGYDNQGGVPVGNGRIWQTFRVPSMEVPTMTIWYRIRTHDLVWGTATNKYYDSFEIYINDVNWSEANAPDPNDAWRKTRCRDNLGVPNTSNPGLVFCDGNPSDSTGTGPFKDLGWRNVELDMSQFKGEEITLYIATFNRVDGWYNTWAYVDDISVNWCSTP